MLDGALQVGAMMHALALRSIGHTQVSPHACPHSNLKIQTLLDNHSHIVTEAQTLV